MRGKFDSLGRNVGQRRRFIGNIERTNSFIVISSHIINTENVPVINNFNPLKETSALTIDLLISSKILSVTVGPLTGRIVDLLEKSKYT